MIGSVIGGLIVFACGAFFLSLVSPGALGATLRRAAIFAFILALAPSEVRLIRR